MNCDAQCWSAIGAVVSAVATCGAVLVAYFQLSRLARQIELQGQQSQLLEQQIKETHDWNRRKATQEMLQSIADGSVRDILRRLREEFDCDVAAEPPPEYEQVLAAIPADKQKDFKAILITLTNLFEAVAIGIRHNVFDENIAYDYLGKMVPASYFFAEPLVEERRKRVGFDRAIGSLEYCAVRWQERLEGERPAAQKRRRQRELVPARPSLLES